MNAADGTATNTDKFMNVWGHESAHEYTDSEKVANSVGSFTNSMWDWSNTLNLTSTDTTGNATSDGWAQQQMQNQSNGLKLINNSYQAASVKPSDRRNNNILMIGTAAGLTGLAMYKYDTNNPEEALTSVGKEYREKMDYIKSENPILYKIINSDPTGMNKPIQGLTTIADIVAKSYGKEINWDTVNGTMLILGVSGAVGGLADSGFFKSTPKNGSNFIVDSSGQVFPVPKGATGPVPNINSAGKQTGVAFVGGEIKGVPANMRVMDSTPAKNGGNIPEYIDGYIKYEKPNPNPNYKAQGVNPYTGKPGSKADTHFPINSRRNK